MPSEVLDNPERSENVQAAGPARHARSLMLVRHGRTAYNLAGRIQGDIDIPLDDVGEWQVQQSAKALRELYVDRRPDARRLVVSSDLGRAMQTARAFADPLRLEVHPDPRMRERNFGDWEGRSVDELSRDFPEDYGLWTQLRGGELRHGAEEKRHVGRRGVEGLRQWSEQAGPDTDLFVFAHGAWIAETVQTLLGLDAISSELTGLLSMRNAHWARLIPLDQPDGSLIWRLMDYNHGPAIADTEQWEHPAL